MATDKYIELLRHYWGYESFRSIQQDIIESVGNGKDTLGLMPTGGGKSICFQVPALALEGINIVVTPLIALMKDQVSKLRMNGIKAEAIYAGMTHDDIERIYDNCIYGDYKFLYISPERLASQLFREKLSHFRKICMITVDEAHCVSQWGYDFRPSYLKIAEIRHIIPYHVPVLALTATATPKVVDDIQERLEFTEKNVFSMSFERKNLAYIVRETENKAEEMLHILQKYKEGSAIVYTHSRKLTSELSRFLNHNKISADSYHAGYTDAEKDLKQINWTKGRVRVMVATNAFGMGIDKADVRLVIHYNLPDSVEAYFQEAGRAGRDGKKAYAVLLYNRHDDAVLRKRVADSYPAPDYIRQVYEDTCYFLQIGDGEGLGRTMDFSMDKFCTYFHHFPVVADSALKILSNAGYIDYQEENDFKSRVHFILHKEELYTLGDYDKGLDKLINAMLRNYTGLFADFVYVDESYLSIVTGFNAETIYNMMTTLSKRRVIDYIPRRRTPTVGFTLPRIDKERIILKPMVYETRKIEFAQRIETMIQYASNGDICRSQMLLRYFGEENDHECGICDVCLSKKKKGFSADAKDKATTAISTFLADGKWHKVTELAHLLTDRNLLKETLRTMLGEEEIETKDGQVRLSVSKE